MSELATRNQGNRLSEAELIALAISENKIVPCEWQRFCENFDQVKWFYRIRNSFNLRLQALSAYYSGEELPTNGLNRKQKKALLAWVDYWTAYYDLLQSAWKAIKKTRFRTETEELFQISDEITPGRLLLHLIHLCAAAKFYECQVKFYNFSGGALRALLQTRKDILCGKRVPSQKISASAIAERQAKREFGSFFFLELEILYFCANNIAPTDKRVQKKLENVLTHHETILSHVTKDARKLKSYQWLKSVLKSGTQGGGYE